MHVDVVGATRTGKTNYIESQIEGAFAFIDKHGEAARRIADAFTCVYWRLADLSYPIALNPLQDIPADLHGLVADRLASLPTSGNSASTRRISSTTSAPRSCSYCQPTAAPSWTGARAQGLSAPFRASRLLILAP